MDPTLELECSDYQAFQASLLKMREVDDKIIHMLNTTLPTNSFRGTIDPTSTCKDLHQQLLSTYEKREAGIKECITVTARRVKNLNEDKESGGKVLKDLRKEQNKLRMLQSELSVEEVVKERSLRMFKERCRPYYKT